MPIIESNSLNPFHRSSLMKSMGAKLSSFRPHQEANYTGKKIQLARCRINSLPPAFNSSPISNKSRSRHSFQNWQWILYVFIQQLLFIATNIRGLPDKVNIFFKNTLSIKPCFDAANVAFNEISSIRLFCITVKSAVTFPSLESYFPSFLPVQQLLNLFH